MKSTVLWGLFGLVCLSASASVQVIVCDPNDLRPLNIHEVMLGTQVSLLVQADANDLWSGGLFIDDTHRSTGLLSRRGTPDPNSLVSEAVYGQDASCLAAAGEYAFILPWNDSWMSGFDLYTDDLERTSGDWFVLDYTPVEEGFCTVHFFDHDVSWTVADPNRQIPLINTASRDLSGTGTVNFQDFALLAAAWMRNDCNAPDWCGGADLDRSGSVDIVDLFMFADFWLWGTPDWQKSLPTPPPAGPEPTVFYTLTDPNGVDEIALEVGQSVRVYIDMSTLYGDVFIFNMEAMISDPNLGWIDNAPGGSAEILAWPRYTAFDQWGPGYEQPEGIQFLAVNIGGFFQDGAMASFVYTATAVGDVTLSLYDHQQDPCIAVSPMVIHQYEPQLLMMSGGTTPNSTTQTSLSETVQMLEDIWDNEPEVRNVIEEDRWNEFIDAVKSTADDESN